MNVDYWTWRTWSKLLMVICFFLLVLVLIPCVGMVRNGSRSWIGVGAFSIQPSEFMKLAMIAFLAKFLSEKQKHHIVQTGVRPGTWHRVFSIFDYHVPA